MAFEYGGRLNKGDYFSTKIDIDNETAETKGTIDGVPVEFSGGSSDFSTATITLNLTITNPDATIASEELVNPGIPYPSAENYYYLQGGIEATNHEVDILLYQGVGFTEISASDEDSVPYSSIVGTPTCTGGVTYVEESEWPYFEVTGDGTITATLDANY